MGTDIGSFSTTFELRSLAATEALAARIAAGLRSGEAVALEGDLGAGKTALVRAILRALGMKETVPSPTFTLMQEYETGRFPVYHCDLYRIQDISELTELALEDAMAEGVAFIEWPDRMHGLPDSTLRIRLEIVTDGMRKAEVSGPARWAEFLAGVTDVEGG